jgi:hypothetical protein
VSELRREVRASDADRERLIAELREHMAAGRLSLDELEQRTQTAYAARTTAELDELRHDLPPTAQQAALAYAARRSRLARRATQQTGGVLLVFVVSTLIWLVDGASGQFWPVWLLILLVLSAGRSAWELYGPGADLDHFEAHLDTHRAQRLGRRRRGRLGPGS